MDVVDVITETMRRHGGESTIRLLAAELEAWEGLPDDRQVPWLLSEMTDLEETFYGGIRFMLHYDLLVPAFHDVPVGLDFDDGLDGNILLGEPLQFDPGSLSRNQLHGLCCVFDHAQFTLGNPRHPVGVAADYGTVYACAFPCTNGPA